MNRIGSSVNHSKLNFNDLRLKIDNIIRTATFHNIAILSKTMRYSPTLELCALIDKQLQT